jgi:SWI/SNF-related matrix-associated actin-dependent regulator of chromatin subfamily D
MNIETGQGVPAWALKIEGRLLEVRSLPSYAHAPSRSTIYCFSPHPNHLLSFRRTNQKKKQQLPNVRKDKQPTRQFSTFIKRLIVELERDPQLYPEGNIVEVCVSSSSVSSILQHP